MSTEYSVSKGGAWFLRAGILWKVSILKKLDNMVKFKTRKTIIKKNMILQLHFFLQCNKIQYDMIQQIL